MKKKFIIVLGFLIFTAGMVVSACIISRFIVKVEQADTISVKGFAETPVISDYGTMNITVKAENEKLEAAVRQLKENVKTVKAQLVKAGFKPDQIEIKPFTVNNEKVYDESKGKYIEVKPQKLRLSQELNISTGNVKLLKDSSISIQNCMGNGIMLDVYGPFFYVSDLSKVKLKLMADATANAAKRARAIAGRGGASLGKIVKASQGVFQVNRPNDTTSSSYGNYDKETIEKSVRAVVSIKYKLK
ncbi:SIMPL domain-containing protein [Lentisphaerota bacterium ZTH]|nr:SIMPL domain-containing protein [Lentisphaerota bacterium]WET07102.1 SIMPL domain-containing protein [Lentisphaerota bacterium ZTH]